MAVLGTLKGTIILVALAAMSIFGWLKIHDYRIASTAVQKERASVEKQGALHATKAKAAAKRAATDAERMLKSYCRDC